MTAQRRALKQRRNWILIALSVVVIFFVRWNYQPERVESEYFGMTDIAVIAHQGGNLLRPGNTLLAFDHAQSLGVDVLEMDIHASADGELVVIHDETLERTTNGQGLVKLQTLEQLKKLDAAYHW